MNRTTWLQDRRMQKFIFRRAIRRGPWNTASVPSGYSRTLTEALT